MYECMYMIQNTSRSLICEMLDKDSVLNCREMYVRCVCVGGNWQRTILFCLQYLIHIGQLPYRSTVF